MVALRRLHLAADHCGDLAPSGQYLIRHYNVCRLALQPWLGSITGKLAFSPSSKVEPAECAISMPPMRLRFPD